MEAASREFIASMVERAEGAAPDKVALLHGERSMTYRELNASANRLAGRLRDVGAAPGTLVALCLERSFDHAAAVLAIMKTGAAFLPIDLAWPTPRISAVLDRSRPEIVVGRSAQPAPLPPGSTLLLLDQEAAAILSQSCGNMPDSSSPSDVAYVIYTSGSTGAPKGVEITQANLSNFVAWHREGFSVTASDRSAHIAGLGFDAAVWDVWPYLAVGASVSLASDLVRTSPESLQRWLLEEGITIAFVTTALAEPMLAMSWPSDTALRMLLTGGDTLRHRPPAGLPFRVINNYGPTETTIIVTSGEVAPDDEVRPPAIGWPIASSRITIIDEAAEELPRGQVGEILIGGPGVGRGYHRDPVLTAQRFVPDRFSDIPGALAYRSGDLGCVLPDGRIAFKGRVDQQVKIRGNRVELEEVERALSLCCLVAACVVVARGEHGPDRDLVAYVVPKPGGPEPTRLQLHAFVAAALPSYMVPAAYVCLDKMPITSNGKIDRTALPEANERTMLGSAESRAPETPTERRLADIIAGLLGISFVGADDNFFALGGHSLLGTQVILRARETFGVDISLRHLFEAQTIALLAETIEQLIMEQIEAMSEEDAMNLAAD